MLTNIQLLRFIAAFAIVIYHALPVFPFQSENEILSWIKFFGFSGVDVFFVISGFIMWYTTHDQGGAAVASIFIKRRFARIYSGYWPYLLIGVLFLALFNSPLLARKSILESIMLTPIPIRERVIPVSWTLTFELYFYLLFFGLLFFTKKNVQWLIRIFIGSLIVLNLVGTIFFGFYSKSFFSEVPNVVRVLISPYAIEFFAGCLICQVHLKRPARNPIIPLLLSIVIFCAGAIYNAVVLEGRMGTGFHIVERVVFFGSASGLLVHGVATLDRLGMAVFPALSRVLGSASYSLYLSHTLIYSLYIHVLGKGFIRGEYALPIAVVIVIAYSVLHYRFVEQPLYAVVKRRLGVGS